MTTTATHDLMLMSERRFRFAPTPSRPLHAGSALAALVGWALARAAQGRFILRIEDIDHTRCRPEHEQTLLDDLAWLGIDWDEGPDIGGPQAPYRQRQRLHLHDATLLHLQSKNLVYPCTCSRNDIRQALSAPHLQRGNGGEIPYPGTCASNDSFAPLDADRGGYRLRLTALGPTTVRQWHECDGSFISEDLLTTCGDFLLGRPGQPTYQLAVVVDDIAMGITDVVRGRDLEGSTARQIALWQALGARVPRFCHHPLLVDRAGQKLSKRDEASPLADIRLVTASPAPLIADLGRTTGIFSSTVFQATPADFRDAVASMTLPRAWHDGLWPAPH